MSAINSWNEDLEQIEGLRELKADLKAKKEVNQQSLHKYTFLYKTHHHPLSYCLETLSTFARGTEYGSVR